MPIKSKLTRHLVLGTVLAAVYLIGILIRRYYFAVHTAALSGEHVWTMESALFFRYIEMIVHDGVLPVCDKMLEAPDGIMPAQTFSLWGQYLYAYLYLGAHFLRLTNHAADFTALVIPVFFSLGVLAVFAAARQINNKDNFSATIAALFYALTLPSVVRSTGLEISDENAALPFVFCHFGLLCAYLNKPKHAKALAAGAALGLALCLWDLVQLYAVLVLLILAFFALRKNDRTAKSLRRFVLLQAGVLLPLTALSKYLVCHGFSFSPFVMLSVLVAAGEIYWRFGPKYALPLGGLGLVALSFGAAQYGGHYNHFWQLLKYKLLFFNIRPLDPALMPFDARILWTPALHSAHWIDVQDFFLRAFCVAGLLFFNFKETFARNLPARIVLILCGVFTVLFVLFFRLHVYLAFFAALLVALSLHAAKAKGGVPARWQLGLAGTLVVLMIDDLRLPLWTLGLGLIGAALLIRHHKKLASLSVMFLAAALITSECVHTVTAAPRWGRSFYFRESIDLCTWVRNNTGPQAIFAANFGISPSLLLYGQRPVAMHPKFETPQLRNKVARYVKALFSSDEKDFYGFCLQNRIAYYLHSKGTWSDTSPYSWRYISNNISVEQAQNSACYKFEREPDYLRYFYPVYRSGKFSVFRVLTPALLQESSEAAREGMTKLDEGNLPEANTAFTKALALYPNNSKACLGLAKVYNRQGLTGEGSQYAKKALSLTLAGMDITQEG